MCFGLGGGCGGDDSWVVRGVNELKAVSAQAWPDVAPAVVLKIDDEVLASELADPTPFNRSPGSCDGESLSVWPGRTLVSEFDSRRVPLERLLCCSSTFEGV